MLCCCRVDSPVGLLCLASNGSALVGLWMEGQRFFGMPYGALPPCGSRDAVLDAAVHWLDSYWAGQAPLLSAVPLAPQGSPFRLRVWRMLAKIPYGETRTYGELAYLLGSSPRAVGGAVGHNPISIMIPCHRVTGAGGVFTGYAGGEWRQRVLADWEQRTRAKK